MSAIACLDYHIETNCQEICEYFISIYFAEDNLMQYCFPVAATNSTYLRSFKAEILECW